MYLEGGYYVEIFCDEVIDVSGWVVLMLIYFLFLDGILFCWYKVDVVEIWYFYVGSLLELFVSMDGIEKSVFIFGIDLMNG